MGRIVVSYDAPYSILAVGSKMRKLLGFDHSQLHGCILQTLEGPDTDTTLLRLAIKSTRVCAKAAPCQIILYDSRGRSKNIMVTCSRHTDACGAVIGCTLYMKESPALTVGETFHLPLPLVLAFAAWPYAINSISGLFSESFGYSKQDLTGSSLLSLTAVESEPDVWAPLIRSAASGSIGSGSVCMRLRCGTSVWCSVTCLPVVEWPNSRIAYFAVVAEPRMCPSHRAADAALAGRPGSAEDGKAPAA